MACSGAVGCGVLLYDIPVLPLSFTFAAILIGVREGLSMSVGVGPTTASCDWLKGFEGGLLVQWKPQLLAVMSNEQEKLRSASDVVG